MSWQIQWSEIGLAHGMRNGPQSMLPQVLQPCLRILLIRGVFEVLRFSLSHFRVQEQRMFSEFKVPFFITIQHLQTLFSLLFLMARPLLRHVDFSSQTPRETHLKGFESMVLSMSAARANR